MEPSCGSQDPPSSSLGGLGSIIHKEQKLSLKPGHLSDGSVLKVSNLRFWFLPWFHSTETLSDLSHPVRVQMNRNQTDVLKILKLASFD